MGQTHRCSSKRVAPVYVNRASILLDRLLGVERKFGKSPVRNQNTGQQHPTRTSASTNSSVFIKLMYTLVSCLTRKEKLERVVRERVILAIFAFFSLPSSSHLVPRELSTNRVGRKDKSSRVSLTLTESSVSLKRVLYVITATNLLRCTRHVHSNDFIVFFVQALLRQHQK